MHARLTRVLLRFGLGLAAAVGTGFVVFGRNTVVIGRPEFLCLTVGALTAAVLALLRASRPGQALALAAAWGLFKLGLVQSAGWIAASSGLVMAGGVYVSALIFDLLARRGIFFGKFLFLGPLLAGVFLAFTPLARYGELTQVSVLRVLLQHVFIGLVIGNGVGFGVEVADLFAAEPASVQALDSLDADTAESLPDSGESRLTKGHHFER